MRRICSRLLLLAWTTSAHKRPATAIGWRGLITIGTRLEVASVSRATPPYLRAATHFESRQRAVVVIGMDRAQSWPLRSFRRGGRLGGSEWRLPCCY